jgi:hypothetical protein
MHARIISARYPRIVYATISTQIEQFRPNSMITNQLQLKNNSMPSGRQQLSGTISDARFKHSALEFDAVDMVLHQKISQLCCMLQLSNNALGAQKSP